jgi:hypothetical protein
MTPITREQYEHTAIPFAKKDEPIVNETAAIIRRAINAKIKGAPQFSPKYPLTLEANASTDLLTSVKPHSESSSRDSRLKEPKPTEQKR